MRDGHIGAGGIYTIQAAFSRPAFYQGRNDMGGEDDRPLGDLLQDTCSIRAIECDYPQAAEFFNRVAIMNDLSNNIDRAWMCRIFCYLTNRLQGINYAITIATRRYFNDFHLFLIIRQCMSITLYSIVSLS